MGKAKRKFGEAYPVNLSETALRNIEEIVGYISFLQQAPATAVKVGDKIFGTIDRISIFPFAYKECPYLPTKSKMYRQAKCLSWSIIFKILPSEIRILGIIHQSRHPAIVKHLRKIN